MQIGCMLKGLVSQMSWTTLSALGIEQDFPCNDVMHLHLQLAESIQYAQSNKMVPSKPLVADLTWGTGRLIVAGLLSDHYAS